MLFKKTDENNFSDKFEHVYCICRLDNIQLIYFSLFKFDLVFWVCLVWFVVFGLDWFIWGYFPRKGFLDPPNLT